MTTKCTRCDNCRECSFYQTIKFALRTPIVIALCNECHKSFTEYLLHCVHGSIKLDWTKIEEYANGYKH